MTVVIEGLTTDLYDGVRETTQTQGQGTYQLDGAAVVSGQTYRTFVEVAVGKRVPYVVWFGAAFERGLGTVTAGAPPTLSRDLILGSSNSNNAVSWGSGVKDIWLDAPSELLDQIVASTGVDADSITNSLLANMPAWTFKIRNTTTTGDPSDASMSNITTDTTPQTTDFLLGFLSTGEIRKYTAGSVVDLVPASSGGTPGLMQRFTSSGTWTKPSGLDYIEVEGCAGGGGGGGVNADGVNTMAAGGGGGGGIFKTRIVAANLGSTVSVTVGSGGNGGGAGAFNGTNGGSSSFGSFASATGGGGGIGTGTSSGSGVAEGGDGGDTTYSGTQRTTFHPAHELEKMAMTV